jgi:hypothetical protein
VEILLTILTVFAGLALLGVIAIGFLLTLKSLQSIRGWFEKIVVGLRASEHQMAPLGVHVDALLVSTRQAIVALDATRARLAETERRLTAGASGRRHEN